MSKFIHFKDVKAMRGSRLYDLLSSNDPKDLKEAEALYRDISAKEDRNWLPQYQYLRNWNVGSDVSSN